MVTMLNNAMYDEEYNLEDVSTDDTPSDFEISPMVSPNRTMNAQQLNNVSLLESFLNNQLREMTNNINSINPNIQVVSQTRFVYEDPSVNNILDISNNTQP